MQQELVHKDNQDLRSLVRSWIEKEFLPAQLTIRNLDIVFNIEDYVLPSLIYSFYQLNNEKSFGDFLDKKTKSIIDRNLLVRIEGLIEDLIVESEKYSKSHDIRILGDIHPGGSTKFKTGKHVSYSDYPDYYNLVNDLSKEIFPDYKRFFPKASIKDDHIERKFVAIKKEAKSKVEVEDFYFNLGRIVPFLLYLRAIDINAENLIISLPYPILFDMETVFSGPFNSNYSDYSIDNTGIIPLQKGWNTSVLTGGIEPKESLLKPLITGTDLQPSIHWRTLSKGKYNNIPFLNGKPVSPVDYLGNFKQGWEDTVPKLLSKNLRLQQIFKNHDAFVRVIFRPTKIYRFLTLKSCYPQIFQKQDLDSYLYGELQKQRFIYNVENLGVEESEIKYISDLKVPVYYANINSDKIICPEKNVVARWDERLSSYWLSHVTKCINKEFFEKQLVKSSKSIS